jgi:hypothetical protein
MRYRPKADPGVDVVFTGTATGNLSLVVGGGDVVGARSRALDLVGARLDQAVFMQQVHSGALARVSSADAGRGSADHADAVAGVDALLTTAEDLALVVLVADCVPVVLIAPHHGIAAVHAGRGGVVAGIVGTTVAALAPAGAEQVIGVVGPAIAGCCYEVGQAMQDDVADAWPAARATTTWGTPSLDLPAAVTAQLHAAGVGTVERLGQCTRCSGDRWFSHRAATAGERTPGRQAGIVVRSGAAGKTAAPAQSSTTLSLQSP